MKVLLSIKPVFASQIESGNKKYEYRRVIFNNEVKTVVIYVTAPVKKVIGEFEVDSILFDDIENLWKKTKDHSGISKNIFYEYFSNKDKGYAIKIKSFQKYDNPLCIKEQMGLHPPQSFIYLNQKESNNARSRT